MVRRETAGAFIGEGEVSTLIQALQDQNGDVRSVAAYALGQIGTPEALKAV